MAAKKVILFTAGQKLTEAEIETLTVLNALTQPLFEVSVINKAAYVEEEIAHIVKACDYHINAPNGYTGIALTTASVASGVEISIPMSMTSEGETVTGTVVVTPTIAS